MNKEPRTPEQRVSDPASVQALAKAMSDGCSTCFTRMDTQSNQCKFGTQGICCRICTMGPCRITPRSPLGVCGADAHTIVARNFLRQVAAGAAAHSDHGRHLVLLLRNVAAGKVKDYQLKDTKALYASAKQYGVEAAHEKRPI